MKVRLLSGIFFQKENTFYFIRLQKIVVVSLKYISNRLRFTIFVEFDRKWYKVDIILEYYLRTRILKIISSEKKGITYCILLFWLIIHMRCKSLCRYSIGMEGIKIFFYLNFAIR